MMNIGMVVTSSSGARYRVGEKQGESMASAVYKAVDESTSQPVVLKVLRQGVGPLVANNFWQEGIILGMFARAEKAAGDGVRNTPRVLGTLRERKVHFLALEFITGTPLDRLLEKGPLTEQDALVVADQVLRVLELLHESLRRSYTGFQLLNIWVQRSSASSGADDEGAITGVKVVDWNHVSDEWKEGREKPQDFNPAHDLARFGGYFYRMLMDKGANERGETVYALETRAGERWQEISLVTRQIALKALHRDPRQRFTSAKAFRAAIQEAQALWQRDPFDLIIEIRRQFSALSKDEPDVELVDRLAAGIDMAKRLGDTSPVLKRMERQLNEKIGAVSLNWESGAKYYQVDSYREALKKWQPEAEAQGRIDLWRWVMAAQVGEQLGRRAFASLREQVEQAVVALSQGKLEKAKDALDSVQDDLRSSQAARALIYEVQARSALAQAELLSQGIDADSWEKAARAYQKADSHFNAMPSYHTLIRDEEGLHDLKQRAELWYDKAKARRQVSAVEQRIIKLLENDFWQGLREFTAIMQRDPDNEAFARICLNQGRRVLELKQVEQAVNLFEVGVLYAQVPLLADELDLAWKEAVAEVNRERERRENALNREQERKEREHREQEERRWREHREQEERKQRQFKQKEQRKDREFLKEEERIRRKREEEKERMRREHEEEKERIRHEHEEEKERIQREHEKEKERIQQKLNEELLHHEESALAAAVGDGWLKRASVAIGALLLLSLIMLMMSLSQLRANTNLAASQEEIITVVVASQEEMTMAVAASQEEMTTAVAVLETSNEAMAAQIAQQGKILGGVESEMTAVALSAEASATAQTQVAAATAEMAAIKATATQAMIEATAAQATAAVQATTEAEIAAIATATAEMVAAQATAAPPLTPTPTPLPSSVTPTPTPLPPPPVTAILEQTRLRSEPSLQGALVLLDGQNGRPPSPVPVGTELDVLAKTIVEGFLFLQVRAPQQSPLFYWILYPSSSNEQPNLSGITPEQVNALPVVGP